MTSNTHPRLRLVVDNGQTRMICDLPDTDAFVAWGTSERGWSDSTRQSYAYRVEAADRWLRTNRDTGLDLADTDDLRAWLADVATNSANTRSQYRGALAAYFAWLGQTGAASFDPTADLGKVRQRRKLPKALTSDQAGDVLEASRGHGPAATVMVATLLYAGLRNRELRNLTWDHIEDGYLRIVGKGDKDRVVPINHELDQVLQRWRAMAPPSMFLLASPRDAERCLSPDAVRYRIRRVGEDAGIDGLHPHQLRHTFATMLIEANVPIHEVQELMGHASLATTEKYLRVFPDRLAGAVGRIHLRRDGG